MEQLNSSAVPFNISSTPGDPPPASWASIKLVSVVVVSICFLLGVPGNIAVIILKPNWQHLSSLSQSLMLNLAISDLICLLPLPLWIYTFVKGWTLGLVACKLLAYLMYCSLYSSLLTVTVLSVQRYLQVVHLQKIFDQVGKRRLLVLLWLVTMILSIPALVVRHVIKDQHGTDCHFQYSSQSQQVAVMLTETLTGFVAISVVAFSYIGLHRKVNQAAFFNNPQTTRLVTSVVVKTVSCVLVTVYCKSDKDPITRLEPNTQLVEHLQNIFDRVGKRRLLVLVWLITMILSIPALVIQQVIKDQHGTSCTGT
ncbi:hypothetical protein NQZ68_034911 [Dissostichus eleginoides]|nr:hypothetical protein NQZ68_034911 [Dissostichus eleginoides]